MHISPCVVNVMAAAAADFPGFPKPYTAANLETKPSDNDSMTPVLQLSALLQASSPHQSPVKPVTASPLQVVTVSTS